MKVVSPKEMKEIDNISINKLGIPGIVLMENAALKVCEEIVKSLVEISGKNILIFAGKGNNGGDAFAVARHLFNRNAQVEVCIACNKKDISGDAKTNLDILENMGVSTYELSMSLSKIEILESLKKADLVIDGIFGTGFKGELKELLKEIINTINSSRKPVISIDIPSGVVGATGEVPSICIKATKTVTFALPKIGIVVNPGSEYSGEVVVVDIGIPKKIIDYQRINMNIIDSDYVATLIPTRKTNSNKADFGKVFIITGSKGMTGAGCLCGKAALRSGAGLVYLGVPFSLAQIYDAALTESITISLEEKSNGYLSMESEKQILNWISHSTVAAVGPGLSINDDIVELIGSIIENSEVPLILDADALNAVARDVSVLRKLKSEAIITPHPGEMAKLLGISNTDVQNNRIETAREFAAKWNVITVLKGSRSLVAFPDGTIYINPTGNSGMATGGTGDVLTGLLAGLIGQGVKPRDAAVAGVYIHGLAGDMVAAIKGEHGLIAGDLVEELPYAIKQLTCQLQIKNDE